MELISSVYYPLDDATTGVAASSDFDLDVSDDGLLIGATGIEASLTLTASATSDWSINNEIT